MNPETPTRKYVWIAGSILALAATNVLVTVALIFFDYGTALETTAGSLPSRPVLLTILFYIFAPLIALPIRMGWPLPGGSLVVLINAIIWACAVYFLVMAVAEAAITRSDPTRGRAGER